MGLQDSPIARSTALWVQPNPVLVPGMVRLKALTHYLLIVNGPRYFLNVQIQSMVFGDRN